MRNMLKLIVIVFFSMYLSCANYHYKQLQNARASNGVKIVWKYPTFAYSYIKTETSKAVRNQIDSIFYLSIKENLSIIPQDSFYIITNELKDNDSAVTSLKKILKRLQEYDVDFVLFPEYYNFFKRTLKGKGGFRITIGKGVSSKPTKFEVVDSTSFFLATTLAYLDKNENLKTKIIKSQLPTTYTGRRNKYFPGEHDSFRAFELEAIQIMTTDLREKIKIYINTLDSNHEM